MRSKQLRLSFRVLVVVLLSSAAALAQTKVTSPMEQFGHNIGDDYFLVNYTHDVDLEEQVVKIEAVGYKRGGVLFIRGEEYLL